MTSNFKGVNSTGKMKRLMSRKSHSWWWDSHISPKNSKWLAENLEEMDRRVKEMLKLIEEEGDSFAKKAEMYYHKRPELVAHVEDFYRMYRALAERYDHATGELRKNIQSENHLQGLGSGFDFGSEPPSPSVPSFDHTPESKHTISKPGQRAAGFEVFLGSGGTSDRSRKGSHGSSSSSESDSDSDHTKDFNGDGISIGMHQRILELENELCIVKEKLSEHEKCGQLSNVIQVDLGLKVSALENDLVVANEKLRVSEAEILSLRQKLREKNLSFEATSIELSYENMVLSKLETRVAELESELHHSKHEIEGLKGVISARDQTIEQYKAQAADASEKFLLEKSRLEADIVNLEGVIKELKAEIGRISQEKLQLETSILKQQHLIEELKDSAAIFADRISLERSLLKAEISTLSQANEFLEAKLVQLEAEKVEVCAERDVQIAEVNASLDALKQKVGTLLLERDELGERAKALNDDIRCREDHVHQLHLEHVKLIKEIEEAIKAGGELKERVKELEEEVERQNVAISDGSEGKRQAIRQLCISLEHYRDGYYHLRQLLQGHCKRLPAQMAT